MAASLRVAISRNSAGTPRAHQLVGMVVDDQLAVLRLDLVVGGVRAQAQHIVGIAVVRHEARAEEAELARRRSRSRWRCRARTGSSLGCRMPSAAATCIRPSSTCCSSFVSSLSSAGDLVGIGLVAGHVLLRQVEDALDVARPPPARSGTRCLKASTSSAGDDAVRLGHLGAERDDADGEGDVLLRLGRVPAQTRATWASSPSSAPPASPTAVANPEISARWS